MEQNICRVGEDTSDTGVYLPEELIISILKRLPVKSLLRFVSVCQSWYSLIKNPNFISTHLSYQIAISQNCISNHSEPPRFLLYVKKPQVCERCLVHSGNDSCDQTQAPLRQRCYVYSDNDSFDRTQELFPEYPPGFVLEIAGMCNGIVCLGQTQRVNAVIWNPSLRKHLHLDIPHTVRLREFAPGSSSVHPICGIGFDLLSNDYKFVSIAISSNPFRKMEAEILSVCVYSLNEGAWKHVNSDFVIRANCPQSSGVYFNGVIHWLVLDYSKIPGVLVSILTFNLADETPLFRKA